MAQQLRGPDRGGSVPSETRLFAQALLGRPICAASRPLDDAKSQRELLEWLSQISPAHATQLRALEREEENVAAKRAQLEWLASISPRHALELSRVQAAEAQASLARRQFDRFAEEQALLESGWDPAKHPRRGGAPNAGWFAGTGGAGGGGYGTSASGEERLPTSHMLSLAGEWWDAKEDLEQNRRDVSRLTDRVTSERSQLGIGGHYTYVHTQNLAKAERDLAAAKSETPKLASKVKDLEQEYKDSGYEDIPHHSWTARETIVGGRGIENVGQAVGMGVSPAGVTPTDDELDVALSVPLLRWLGKTAARKALRRSFGRQPVEAAPGTQSSSQQLPGRGGRYGHFEDPPTANSGKDFTPTQKKTIIAENERQNGGVIRDDRTGRVLVRPQQRKRGVKAPPDEAQVDHVYPKSRGGPNTYSNAEVRSRLDNVRKGKRIE